MDIIQLQSSPTSFHTVPEFQSPSPFPSISDFKGFTDDDADLPSIPTTAPTAPTASTAPTVSTVPTTALAAPPIYNADASLRTFLSSEDALSYCQSWARDHGNAIRKCRTKSRRKEKTIYKIYFECECAGKKQGSKVPKKYRVQKDQASKACACPFRGSVTENNGAWSIQISHPDHTNHLPFLQPGILLFIVELHVQHIQSFFSKYRTIYRRESSPRK